MPDSKTLLADCMSAQETWEFRVRPSAEETSQIFKVDIATGATTPVSSGPGVKIAPAVLSTGEIAYMRHRCNRQRGRLRQRQTRARWRWTLARSTVLVA